MGERYGYENEVRKDLKVWLMERVQYQGWTAEDMESYYNRVNAYDDAFVSDSVTGNASGSYFCNAWKAEEALCHNIDLLFEALEEFGSDASYMKEHGAEGCDVTIRCYILGQVFDDVWGEVREEIDLDHEAEEGEADADGEEGEE